MPIRGLATILLLVLSNVFMTLAWYGHLKFKELKWFENLGLIAIIFISWGLAFFQNPNIQVQSFHRDDFFDFSSLFHI